MNNLVITDRSRYYQYCQIKKDLKYKFIWTSYGRTYLRKDPVSPVVAILKKSDLDILRQDGGVHSSPANPTG